MAENSSNIRLLVLGGTGNVGKLVVQSALKKGYKVRSVTRNLKKTPKFEEGEVEWIEGSILDPPTVDKAVQGVDGIISVLGPKGTGKTDIYSQSARLVVDAMKKYNVKRYLAITPGVSSPQMGALIKWLLPKILKNLRADADIMRDMFRKLDDESVEWTIVQPFPMKNSAFSGKYRVEAGDPAQINPPLKPKTIRADLAEFLVKEMVEKKWNRQIVTIGL